MDEREWRALLTEFDSLALREPATPADLDRVEDEFGAVLPPDLRALYLVSDGVYDNGDFIWPLAKVVEMNSKDWTDWQTATRRRWVEFGTDGAGGPFCVPRDGSGGVVTWNAINQAAYPLAGTVREFWIGWLGGTIST